MNKSRGKLILLSFLAALFLCSCGIPSYFYTTDSYYGINKTESYFYLNSRSDTDGDLNLVTDGPGMLVFYYIDNKESSVNLDSQFKTVFQGTNGIGITPGYISKGEPIISYTTDEKQFNVCAFTKDSGTVQKPKDFAYNLDYRQTDGNIKYWYSLDFNSTDKTMEMILSPDNVIDSSSVDKKIILKRFDGKSFLISQQDIRNSKDEDYSMISKDNDFYYVHVFISLAFQEGNFSNKFWTDPFECGSYRVDLI